MSIALEYADSAPNKQQWENLRPLITDLYRRQQQTARQILMELRNKHNFMITEKMLRDRLSRWQLHKNKMAKSNSLAELSQSFRSSTMSDSTKSLSPNSVSTDSPSPLPASFPVDRFMERPRSRSSSHIKHESDLPEQDLSKSDPGLSQEVAVSRPLETPLDALPQNRLLTAIHDWFDNFLTSTSSERWSLSQCSMLDLTDSIAKSFYYMDTGAFPQGCTILRQAQGIAPSVLQSEHPASFIYLLRGLGASRQLCSRSSGMASSYDGSRLEAFPGSNPRLIGCNGCDDHIVAAHHHCAICYGGYYDLCSACVMAGTHCLNDDHWLIKRLITKDGVVLDSGSDMLPPRWMRHDVLMKVRTGTTHPKPSVSQRLLYVADSRVSSDTFTQVCAFLIRQARDLLGLCHPMALLLEVFQSSADLELLRDRILAIMEVKLANRTKVIDAQSKHLMAAREWVLFQQRSHQELETWANGYLFDGNHKPKTGAELIHLLATAKLEDGQFESASTWLCAVGTATDGMNLDSSPEIKKALHDLATVSWQVDDVDECKIALALAYHNLKSARVVSLRSRCFVLTFYKALHLYLSRERGNNLVLGDKNPADALG